METKPNVATEEVAEPLNFITNGTELLCDLCLLWLWLASS